MTSPTRSIRIVADRTALAGAGAAEFVARARSALGGGDRFSVALAGGTTPRDLYAALAGEGRASPLSNLWPRIHLFWGDERFVAHDHPESNYRMVHDALLARTPLPAENVHPIETTGVSGPEQAAARYETALRAFFGLAPGEIPRFDLVLLGMGADGHTASLFPGSPALAESRQLVRSVWVPPPGAYRVTLTPPALNGAASVLFLVSGSEKAEALREVLEGEHRPDLYPAQIVRPLQGSVLWLVDREAARLLSPALRDGAGGFTIGR